MSMLKLVDFENPVWRTIQGEGKHVGTPSTFVRFWGCDFSCSWCDTKRSWEPGSNYTEISKEDLLQRILQEAGDTRHVVLTGGNPFLQGDGVSAIIVALQQARKYVTVETQGSVFHENMVALPNLLSLSPKLHDWREEELERILSHRKYRFAASGIAETQIKVVVANDVGAGMAVSKLRKIFENYRLGLLLTEGLILQPEFSSGRVGVEAAVKAAIDNPDVPLRVIPQAHKKSLFVR